MQPLVTRTIVLATLSGAGLVAQTNWSLANPAPYANANERAGHGMAFDTARGVAVVFGGRRQVGGSHGDTWEWDGENWFATSPTTSPPPQSDIVMAYDEARGQTILFGGTANPETWAWDGSNWTQLSPANSPVVRRRAAMDYDAARGVLVLFGGTDAGGIDLNDTWEWNGSDWTQRTPALSPPALAGHTLVYDTDRNLSVVFGSTGDTWVWDGTNWNLEYLGIPPVFSPTGRSGHAAAYDRTMTCMLLHGGNNRDDAWVYDGNRWFPVNSAFFLPKNPSSRNDHRMIWNSAKQRLMMFGGGQANGTILRDSWEWTGGSWLQLQTINTPEKRFGHTAEYHAGAGQIVMFGGSIPLFNVDAGDTWRWDGSRWDLQTGFTSVPTARRRHAMTYDSARDRIVVFGGFTRVFRLFDTWEYDGTDWARRSTMNSPPATSETAMAYDSNRGVSVLVGGSGELGNPIGNQVWEFDGTNWTNVTPATGPSVVDHALAFDPTRGVTVLFGGSGAFNQTWEWDGTTWTRRFPATNPPGRSLHQMAFDAARDVVVMFGGSGGTVLNDTWEWDGTDWTRRTTATNPVGRAAFAMAFDPNRAAVVAFGGNGESGALDDTWEYRPVAPAAFALAPRCPDAPTLRAEGNDLPWTGTDFVLRAGNLQPGQTAAFLLDVSAGNSAVPMAALSGAGGCPLGLQPRSMILGQRAGREVRGILPIPNDPGVVGLRFAVQGLISDAGGVHALTNVGRAEVGGL